MTDEDMCAKGAERFYQQIANQQKKDPDFVIDDMSNMAYEFAMQCGFDHPRCFVKYIEDIEDERKINEILSRKSL